MDRPSLKRTGREAVPNHETPRKMPSESRIRRGHARQCFHLCLDSVFTDRADLYFMLVRYYSKSYRITDQITDQRSRAWRDHRRSIGSQREASGRSSTKARSTASTGAPARATERPRRGRKPSGRRSRRESTKRLNLYVRIKSSTSRSSRSPGVGAGAGLVPEARGHRDCPTRCR